MMCRFKSAVSIRTVKAGTALGVSAVLLCVASASAQDNGIDNLAVPGLSAYAPTAQDAPLTQQQNLGELQLEAKLTVDAEPLKQGIKWRVYASELNRDDKLPLVATAEGGPVKFQLPRGNYLVHAAFGRAGATTRITVDETVKLESLVLDAGGLLLDGALPGSPLTRPDKLAFDIFRIEPISGEHTLILPNVPAREIVRLPAGTYHVKSSYGNYNAEIRADLRVEAGKTTEATMQHRAAFANFRLVRNAGGAPLADTAWSVLSPTGESIMEYAGPDPSAVLAAGTYTVVAKNRDRIYQQEVTIKAGEDQTIEVRAVPGKAKVSDDDNRQDG